MVFEDSERSLELRLQLERSTEWTKEANGEWTLETDTRSRRHGKIFRTYKGRVLVLIFPPNLQHKRNLKEASPGCIEEWSFQTHRSCLVRWTDTLRRLLNRISRYSMPNGKQMHIYDRNEGRNEYEKNSSEGGLLSERGGNRMRKYPRRDWSVNSGYSETLGLTCFLFTYTTILSVYFTDCLSIPSKTHLHHRWWVLGVTTWSRYSR